MWKDIILLLCQQRLKLLGLNTFTFKPHPLPPYKDVSVCGSFWNTKYKALVFCTYPSQSLASFSRPLDWRSIGQYILVFPTAAIHYYSCTSLLYCYSPALTSVCFK